MIEFLDSITSIWAAYYDTLALFVVCYLAIRLRSVVAFVILADFVLVYFGQNWIKSLSFWGSLGLDYHYTLGIKDTLLALTLFLLAASPLLTFSYILPAVLCWFVWGSYTLVEYELFLKFYYAWSPLYALCMVLQIVGLSLGDSNAGRAVRRKVIPIDWSGIFQPVTSFMHTSITFNYFKASESNR
jgi:hypothetical protein